MRNRILFLLLAVALAFSAAGCADPFEKEYSYSAPFTYSVGGDSGNATEIGNYSMLKSALLDLISKHEERGVFRFSRYNGSVADDLAAACLEIRTASPLGAYAVEALTCDTSRIVSYYLAEVQISYKRTAEELRDIESIGSLQELESRMRDAVTGYEESMVLRIFSSQVDEAYLSDLAETIYLSDPVAVAAEPVLEISTYPPEGPNRIYDIRVDFGSTPARLRIMERQLEERVEELTGDSEQETAPLQALECARRLSEQLEDGDGETAYAALVQHRADSRGIALGYKALCDHLGIDCVTVCGNVGDMSGEEHWWNILLLEGAYYHVDVSRFRAEPADAFLLDDESLWGIYLWDAEKYPECAGGLRYSDLVPEEPDGGDAPPPQEDPGAEPPATLPPTETPEETDAPVEADSPEETGESGETGTP